MSDENSELPAIGSVWRRTGLENHYSWADWFFEESFDKVVVKSVHRGIDPLETDHISFVGSNGREANLLFIHFSKTYEEIDS